MSVETTLEERTDARQIQQKFVRLLEKKNKVGKTWKYLVTEVIDDNGTKRLQEPFTMQTKLDPKDFPVKLMVGEEYLIPMRKGEGKSKFWNVEDESQYRELFARFDVPVSDIPEKEQAILQITVPPITEGLRADQIEPIETANDKPLTGKRDSQSPQVNDGSQLAVVPEYHGEIIKSPASLLSYLPPIKEAKEYFDYIQEFKRSILDKSDIQKIGNKNHICRSGWEKFVNVFRLDHWIVSTKKETTLQHLQSFKWDKSVQPWIKIPDRDEWLEGIQYTVVVAMKSLTGSVTQGIGLVQQYEGGRADRKEHDILAHAETRAFNRACSKIVGLGEVSAEEVQ